MTVSCFCSNEMGILQSLNKYAECFILPIKPFFIFKPKGQKGQKGHYEVQIDKDDISAKYTYFTKGALEWCYPDTETVRQMFNAAFGTEGDDFYHAPYERFRQYVQERFRMSVEELYALPANQG